MEALFQIEAASLVGVPVGNERGTVRYTVSERVYIDCDKRLMREDEPDSLLFGVYSPTGQIIDMGEGRTGEVVKYYGGAYSLEDAVEIVNQITELPTHQPAMF